ncbi:MAG: hypothetical protein AB8B85_11415 [Paracoccaceae bacterium]
MSWNQRLIYGAVMAFVVFFVGEFVLGAGTLAINIVFAAAMGLFAMLAVTLATRFSERGKK